MADGTEQNLFDVWLSGQRRLLETQSAWFRHQQAAFSQQADGNPDRERGDFQQIWDRNERLFDDWMQSWQDWFGMQHNCQDDSASARELACMLDPRQFMAFASQTLSLLFGRLADGPEFSDMGVLEKKLLRTGRDWEVFREACGQYQSIIADAWVRAWRQYTAAFAGSARHDGSGAGDWLERWLEVADRELSTTLRSPDYLDAQQKLFSAGVACKERQDQLVEQWSDYHGMPTRTEVDDLHSIVYSLRRELRQVQRELTRLKQRPQASSVNSQSHGPAGAPGNTEGEPDVS